MNTGTTKGHTRRFCRHSDSAPPLHLKHEFPKAGVPLNPYIYIYIYIYIFFLYIYIYLYMKHMTIYEYIYIYIFPAFSKQPGRGH